MTIAIITVVLVALAAVLGFAAARPDILAVKRAIRVDAEPVRIFDLINDFHKWSSWSPYEKIDPTMTRKLSGAASGRGAVYEWAGKGKAGAGRMEIVDTTPPTKIKIKLDFIKPFEGHNTAEFTLNRSSDAKDAATEVVWSMYGPSPYIAKLMGLFLNMDKMIGKDFEVGLANLKALAEIGPAGVVRLEPRAAPSTR